MVPWCVYGQYVERLPSMAWSMMDRLPCDLEKGSLEYGR